MLSYVMERCIIVNQWWILGFQLVDLGLNNNPHLLALHDLQNFLFEFFSSYQPQALNKLLILLALILLQVNDKNHFLYLQSL